MNLLGTKQRYHVQRGTPHALGDALLQIRPRNSAQDKSGAEIKPQQSPETRTVRLVVSIPLGCTREGDAERVGEAARGDTTRAISPLQPFRKNADRDCLRSGLTAVQLREGHGQPAG